MAKLANLSLGKRLADTENSVPQSEAAKMLYILCESYFTHKKELLKLLNLGVQTGTKVGMVIGF